MKNIKRLFSLGLVLYLLLLARLIIFKFPDHMTEAILQTWSLEGVLRSMAGSNIMPFSTIWNSLFNATLPVQLPTLIYNIAAFVPLGFLVPLISERARRLVAILVVASSISIVFELIQVFTLLGTGDIDDVILNTFGAAIGYGIFALGVWWKQYFVRFAQHRREF